MSAVIVAFDMAARRNAGLTPDQVLRRARVAAITSGCNNAQRAAVERAAQADLEAGIFSPHQIIQRAKSLATTLAHHPDPSGPAAA